MSRFVLICSFAAMLAASVTQNADAAQSAYKSVWTQDSLACADLGIDPGRVRLRQGDTELVPHGWGTFASRSLVIAGGACKLAAATLRERLQSVASQILEAAVSDIEISNGRAFVRGTDLAVEVRQLARAAYHQSHRFPAIAETGLTAVATYDPYGTFSNACHIAIVAVDIATGQVTIDRFVVVEDAGQLINPMIVEGQIRGGVVQGIGTALYEEIPYDEKGQPLTGTSADYLLPGAAELPAIKIGHLHTPAAATEYGMKGMGEGGAVAPPAAIANAVRDALLTIGTEVNETPITPRRVLAAIARARDETVKG